MSGVASAQLAQVKVTSTTPVTILTASMRTEITLIIVVASSGSTSNFYLYHDDNGTTYDETTILYCNHQITQYTNYIFQAQSPGAGITLFNGGSLGAKVTNTNLPMTYTIYGTTEQR